MKLNVKIPPHKELLLELEQEVDIGSPFIRISSPQKSAIPVAKSLGISPAKIFLHLKKFVGDQVKKGDVLAEAKSLFSAKQFISDLEGTITEIDHQTGSMLIETLGEDANVMNCFFKGTVSDLTPEQIELRVQQGTEFPIFEVNEYTGGPVSYHNRTYLSEEDIENKFIIAEEIIPYDQIKMETLGAKGFVVLHELKKPSNLPTIKLKQIDHFEELMKQRFPYCILGTDHTTMYFYQ